MVKILASTWTAQYFWSIFGHFGSMFGHFSTFCMKRLNQYDNNYSEECKEICKKTSVPESLF